MSSRTHLRKSKCRTLIDKVIIVTGSVEELAGQSIIFREGGKLVLAARDSAALAAPVAEIEAEGGVAKSLGSISAGRTPAHWCERGHVGRSISS
jgi:hypothetical protein